MGPPAPGLQDRAAYTELDSSYGTLNRTPLWICLPEGQ